VLRRAVLIPLLGSLGCESNPLASKDASLSARVFRIEDRSLTADSVAHREAPDFDAGSALLNFDKSMRVLREAPDGSYSRSSREQLQVGQRVLVWTTDVEIRTLVPQYTAVQILILK
jgi:hypothetical protein